MQGGPRVVEGAAPGGVDPAAFDLDRLENRAQRGHRREHRPEVREHRLDQFGPRRVVQRWHRRRLHRRALHRQPRGVPRQVEVAAVVVLDVAERADANHGARQGHGTGRAHEERSPEAMRPGRRRRQAAGGVDDEPSVPQRVHDAVVGTVDALAGVDVHRDVEGALGPPDTDHAHAPPALRCAAPRRRQRPGGRRSRPSTPSAPARGTRPRSPSCHRGHRARTRTAGGRTPAWPDDR